MTEQEYIESGILELYVAGILSEEENLEIYKAMQTYPAVSQEVEKIEKVIVKLTASTAPFSAKFLFNKFVGQLNDKQIDTTSITRPGWISYTGWAASILIGGFLIWALVKNNQLKSTLEATEVNTETLEDQIAEARLDLEEADHLIEVLRDNDIISVQLEAQPAFPDAFAKIYWDKKTKSVYLDAQFLPDPPEGKVYQLWSLTLNPLTPTSLGVIEDFSLDSNKIFAKENLYDSEAFGITLEPAGGSETPNMEALYSLGVVNPSSQ